MPDDPPKIDAQAVINPTFRLQNTSSEETSEDEPESTDEGSTSDAGETNLQTRWPTFVAAGTEAAPDTGATGQDSGPVIGNKLGGMSALNTLPLKNLHLNPALRLPEGFLDQFVGRETVPRSEVDVPVAPEKKVRDDQQFEGSDTAYYLPQYTVAEETVSGTQRLRVQLREKEQGGVLEVFLHSIPPPSIDTSGADVQPLDHELRLVLQSDRGGVQQEYCFQEITRKDNAVRAALTVNDAASLLELQNALTGSQGPHLVAHRTVRIAVPAKPETDTTATLEKQIDQLKEQEQQLDRRRRQLSKRLERARSHWQELGAEDCLGYNPENLEIKQHEGDWLLVDGDHWMMNLKTEKDARRALALARRHTQHCFIGRGSADKFIVGYWKGDSGIETTIPDEVCLGYDIDNLTIEDEGDQWLLTDGNSRMLVLADRADAQRARALARRHVEMCFIGKGLSEQYSYVYWGARSENHPAELKDEREKVKNKLQSKRRTRKKKEDELGQLRGKNYVRVTNRTLEQTIEPVPFAFPSSWEYVFPNLSGEETESGWIHHAVNGHSYYQDASDRAVFKYLPDAFRLARRPKPPYHPALGVKVLPAEEAGGEPDVELTYLAVPYLDTERLNAARDDLQSELPPDADELEFEPLIATEKPAYRLSLPGSGGFTERPEASVHLRDGIDDRVRMSLKDFRTVYQSMMSDQSRVFDGEVLVNIADNDERIDFVSDLQHLVGEVFTYNEVLDAEAGQFDARLTNAVESPLVVETIGARLTREGRRDAGRPVSLDVLKAPSGATELPVELAPNETLALDVRPDEFPPGDGKLDLVFDYEVKQKPDSEAIWDAIVDRTVEPMYERKVEVKTLKSIFGSDEDGDSASAIAYILVEFEQGRTVELSPDALQQTITLSFPVRDFVVGGTNGGVLDVDYTFTVRVIHEDGSEASSAKHTHSQEQLAITNRYLP